MEREHEGERKKMCLKKKSKSRGKKKRNLKNMSVRRLKERRKSLKNKRMEQEKMEGGEILRRKEQKNMESTLGEGLFQEEEDEKAAVLRRM